MRVDVLRLDLIDHVASGNKFYKLLPNLNRALQTEHKTIISFGGAYSNHLHALAAAGKHYGIRTIAVVRGERPKVLSPTLVDAENNGMQLHFVSRQDYRMRDAESFHESLKSEWGEALIIPEGGSNLEGVQGCQNIIGSIGDTVENYDVFALATATGGTLAGIIASLAASKQVVGYAVLKAQQYLQSNVQSFLQKLGNIEHAEWSIQTDYHCGGYAKLNPELMAFFHQFNAFLPIEPVYTGKLFYGLCADIERGVYPQGSRILAIHTGGMQGLRGMHNKLLK